VEGQSIVHNSNIILASKSPRRKFLLEQADIKFEIKSSDVDETVPGHIPIRDSPEYLAKRKASFIHKQLNTEQIILAADTSVFISDSILNKPGDYQEARKMLSVLSGKTHDVITGVCLVNNQKQHSFSVLSIVHLDQLSEEEMDYYITEYKPFDKAGGYGIQDWIGWCKIRSIEGSYSNILGLPMREVYQALSEF